MATTEQKTPHYMLAQSNISSAFYSELEGRGSNSSQYGPLLASTSKAIMHAHVFSLCFSFLFLRKVQPLREEEHATMFAGARVYKNLYPK
ncbi:hypothetical protein CDAR_256711 [Caerostris darwini]|uniref:Uncharacterized protein n=1 Tax=Caerostris darwini TaxID=1538125 RepID=A0AAV4Q134_9ARAC|nr:hypothetical protein CDAR_256711 [Caerostris darwini]